MIKLNPQGQSAYDYLNSVCDVVCKRNHKNAKLGNGICLLRKIFARLIACNVIIAIPICGVYERGRRLRN